MVCQRSVVSGCCVLIGRLAFVGVSFSAFLFRVLYFIRGASLVGYRGYDQRRFFSRFIFSSDGLGPDFNLLTPPPIHPGGLRDGLPGVLGSGVR